MTDILFRKSQIEEIVDGCAYHRLVFASCAGQFGQDAQGARSTGCVKCEVFSAWGKGAAGWDIKSDRKCRLPLTATRI